MGCRFAIVLNKRQECGSPERKKSVETEKRKVEKIILSLRLPCHCGGYTHGGAANVTQG